MTALADPAFDPRCQLEQNGRTCQVAVCQEQPGL